jgi:hypothetical protein
MKKHIFLLAFVLTAFFGTAVAQSNASLRNLDVECLGVEHDGSQTLRATGLGRNKSDAVEQAKKNAVMVVLFAGVRGGKGGCDVRPIVCEPNAREKYARYFDIFFADNGEYLNYISMIDKRLGSNQKKKGKIEVSYRVTVRVLSSELRERLVSDGIIPKETLYDVKY